MNYQENCKHLKACRRLAKMFNIKNRGCNECCTAYEPKIDIEQTINDIEDSMYDIQEGGYIGDHMPYIARRLRGLK